MTLEPVILSVLSSMFSFWVCLVRKQDEWRSWISSQTVYPKPSPRPQSYDLDNNNSRKLTFLLVHFYFPHSSKCQPNSRKQNKQNKNVIHFLKLKNVVQMFWIVIIKTKCGYVKCICLLFLLLLLILHRAFQTLCCHFQKYCQKV